MKKYVQKMLASKRGETIVETLAATLVVVLAFTMLSGAVVSAARIDSSIDTGSTVLSLKNKNQASTTVTVQHVGSTTSNTTYSSSNASDNITGYETYGSDDTSEGLYYYYESN